MSVRGKIQSLNTAIRETIPHMQKVARENPHAQLLVRAVAFSGGARWHIPIPTPVDQLTWTDLEADGMTDMGKAFSMVAEQLKMPQMEDHAFPPVLVLISDGQPTDDYEKGLKQLLVEPWGRKALRIAIGIGDDVDFEILSRFMDNPQFRPLKAENAEILVSYIRWASTVVLQAASSLSDQTAHSNSQGVDTSISAPPDSSASTSEQDIW
jgi:uncharacterized protein YegL